MTQTAEKPVSALEAFEAWSEAEHEHRRALLKYRQASVALVETMQEQAGPHPGDDEDSDFVLINSQYLIERLPRLSPASESVAPGAFELHHVERLK